MLLVPMKKKRSNSSGNLAIFFVKQMMILANFSNVHSEMS